jgi:hypothetical protein
LPSPNKLLLAYSWLLLNPDWPIPQLSLAAKEPKLTNALHTDGRVAISTSDGHVTFGASASTTRTVKAHQLLSDDVSTTVQFTVCAPTLKFCPLPSDGDTLAELTAQLSLVLGAT